MSYAVVSKSADVRSEVGMWSKIMAGAKVGRNSPLGSWSNVGFYSSVGSNVKFGDWAEVGMDCLVDNGSVLRSHEYVPSGHHRHKDGRLSKLAGMSAYNEIHIAYDRMDFRIEGGFGMRNDEYAEYKKIHEGYRIKVEQLLPWYLSTKIVKPAKTGVMGNVVRVARALLPSPIKG